MRRSIFGHEPPDRQQRVRRKKPPRQLFPHDPQAQAVHDGGGTLVRPTLPSRAKWNAMLAAHAPGCGSPIHVAGTNGGTMACGARLNGVQMFCGHCQPNESKAEQLVAGLLEAEGVGSGARFHNWIQRRKTKRLVKRSGHDTAGRYRLVCDYGYGDKSAYAEGLSLNQAIEAWRKQTNSTYPINQYTMRDMLDRSNMWYIEPDSAPLHPPGWDWRET